MRFDDSMKLGPKVDYKRDAVEKIVVTVTKGGQEVLRYSTDD